MKVSYLDGRLVFCLKSHFSAILSPHFFYSFVFYIIFTFMDLILFPHLFVSSLILKIPFIIRSIHFRCHLIVNSMITYPLVILTTSSQLSPQPP
jgi:hypothetical protein